MENDISLKTLPVSFEIATGSRESSGSNENFMLLMRELDIRDEAEYSIEVVLYPKVRIPDAKQKAKRILKAWLYSEVV